jgi:hypothetical protein
MNAGNHRAAPRVEYEVRVRGPRFRSPRVAHRLALIVAAAGNTAAILAAPAVVAVGAPGWLPRLAAGVLLVVLSIALTIRVGGHLRIWCPLTAVVAILAVTVQTSSLLASAAGLTAVLAAVQAVMITRPAVTALEVLREVAFAATVVVAGMVGVAAWNAHVDPARFALFVLAASLGLVITIVWNLGAGLHGLGRVQLALIVSAAALLVAVIVYAAFVRTHGSADLVEGIKHFILWMRRTFGGVPRPPEMIIGFPALVVGVALRSRQREGWWIQVFAVIGTALSASALVSPAARPSYVLISLAYSAIPGLALGFVARYFLVGPPTIRSSRAIERPVRDEPGRFEGLK